MKRHEMIGTYWQCKYHDRGMLIIVIDELARKKDQIPGRAVCWGSIVGNTEMDRVQCTIIDSHSAIVDGRDAYRISEFEALLLSVNSDTQ